MKELIRTEDLVLLSWLQTRLAERGVPTFIFDAHTSAAYAGAMDALARRIMVDDDDYAEAKRILDAAGDATGH